MWCNRWPRKGNGPPPPPRGTDGLLVVKNAFNYNGSSYGFKCRCSSGSPKKRPKYRTPARVTHKHSIGVEIITYWNRFDFCDVIYCIVLHQINSIWLFLMQWIASFWASVIHILEFAQTEQDISDTCVMSVRQAQRNDYNSEAATPENVISNKNSWQFKWCNVLHRVTSNKFHQFFWMYIMFSAPMVCEMAASLMSHFSRVYVATD